MGRGGTHEARAWVMREALQPARQSDRDRAHRPLSTRAGTGPACRHAGRQRQRQGQGQAGRAGRWNHGTALRAPGRLSGGMGWGGCSVTSPGRCTTRLRHGGGHGGPRCWTVAEAGRPRPCSASVGVRSAPLAVSWCPDRSPLVVGFPHPSAREGARRRRLGHPGLSGTNCGCPATGSVAQCGCVTCEEVSWVDRNGCAGRTLFPPLSLSHTCLLALSLALLSRKLLFRSFYVDWLAQLFCLIDCGSGENRAGV